MVASLGSFMLKISVASSGEARPEMREDGTIKKMLTPSAMKLLPVAMEAGISATAAGEK